MFEEFIGKRVAFAARSVEGDGFFTRYPGYLLWMKGTVIAADSEKTKIQVESGIKFKGTSNVIVFNNRYIECMAELEA